LFCVKLDIKKIVSAGLSRIKVNAAGLLTVTLATLTTASQQFFWGQRKNLKEVAGDVDAHVSDEVATIALTQ
jgi:hypothetical protein